MKAIEGASGAVPGIVLCLWLLGRPKEVSWLTAEENEVPTARPRYWR